MPLIISSSVVLAQSSASRLTRKLLTTVGHPLRLICAFHEPALVLKMVAIFDAPHPVIAPFNYCCQIYTFNK